MLRKVRVTIAAIFFAGITLIFLGFGHQWFGWMAKIQFLPSWLALNMAVVGAILLFTLLFGRLYCSVICPLGIFQDIMIRLSRKQKRKPKYAKMPQWVRYIGFTIFIIAVAADIQVLISVLEPYSNYGIAVRAVTGIGTSDGWWTVSLLGSVTILAVAFCAWFQGRLWCNSICPVGFILSVFSRFAPFRIRIDANKCNGCTACDRQCKAACINVGQHTVDTRRCVDCFDCIGVCRQGAISFSAQRPGAGENVSGQLGNASGAGREKAGVKEGTSVSPEGKGRRNFLTAAVMVAAGTLGSRVAAARGRVRKAADAARNSDEYLTPLEPKQPLASNTPPVPFGAGGIKHFYDHCVACQLCVASCPNHVLKPSTNPAHLMEPEMSFQDGYCRPECNVCSTVCPAGAIRPVDVGAKLGMHIGTAHVNLESCVVSTDGVSCGNCARHCPVGAIRMVESAYEHKIPVVNEEICIGCGACENLCPVRPVSAITDNGLQIHR